MACYNEGKREKQMGKRRWTARKAEGLKRRTIRTLNTYTIRTEVKRNIALHTAVLMKEEKGDTSVDNHLFH